ncbi:MAG: ABC transporter ATP-binding protein [Actinobacteria bacterium]|nr:ABC transporter ATP-binding protein [Actinomycetota bacterium]
MTTVICLHGVSRTFEGEPPVEVLVNCDLEVHAGESVAVVGASGAGKSTLLNVLGLLDRPTIGKYWLMGRDTTALHDHERSRLRAHCVSFVFQDSILLPHQSVQENVELGQLYKGIGRRERRGRAQAALEWVDLGHRRTAMPYTLSGGERQRAAIARALATVNPVILCDEPTGNLDSVATERVLELLEKARVHRGVTVVLITHDAEVAGRCTRRVHIRDGRLINDDRRE